MELINFSPSTPISSEILISSSQIFLHSFKIEFLISFLSNDFEIRSAAHAKFTAVGRAVLICSIFLVI